MPNCIRSHAINYTNPLSTLVRYNLLQNMNVWVKLLFSTCLFQYLYNTREKSVQLPTHCILVLPAGVFLLVGQESGIQDYF